MEALVAVTVGSVVLLLASTLFLIQNDYYEYVLERTRTQDNARSVTELVADDVRSVPPGGFVEADSTRMVFRRPVAMGAICDVVGPVHVVHIPGGTGDFDTDEVSGFGVRADDGSWTFVDQGWSGMYGGTTFAANFCAGEGADTAGIADEFFLFGDLATLAGVTTEIGDAVSFYTTLELSLDRSALDSTTYALYRGVYGETLTEFATGLEPGGIFSYRTGDTSHVGRVTGSDLDDIDGVRVEARAVATITSATRSDVESEVVADLLLRNGN